MEEGMKRSDFVQGMGREEGRRVASQYQVRPL